MTQLRGMLVGLTALFAGSCGSSAPAANGGDVITAAGSGADPASVETSLAAASGVVSGITAADLPACMSAATAVTDGGAPGCRCARTILSCDLGLGAGSFCTSDDPQQCPGGAPADHCKMLCGLNEYAVTCGGGPAQPVAGPPADCRALPPNPGGAVFACCPCL